MSEYLAPGVYVEEVPSGNKPIEAAGTSTAGMVGMTARGPVNQPTLVTSQGEFARVFGGLLEPQTFKGHDALPYAAEGFFANGGSRLYVVRIVGEGAREATLSLVAQDTAVVAAPKLAEATVVLGVASVKQLTLTGAEVVEKGSFLIVDGAASEVVEIGKVAGDGPEKTVTLEKPLTNSHSSGVTLLPVQPVLKVYARYPGAWGDSLRTVLRPASLISTKVNNNVDSGGTSVQLESAFGLYPGSVVSIRIDDVTGEQITMQLAGVNTETGVVQFATPLDANLAENMSVVSQEFTLTVERIENGKAVESETFERLSMVEEHPRYAPRIVGSWKSEVFSKSGESSLIRLQDTAATDARNFPLVTGVGRCLSGGSDGLDAVDGVNDKTYCGTASDDPDKRTGVFALENEPAISLVAVPGQTSVTVQKALVAHCEHMRYRFAVLDTPIGADLADARTHRQNFDSTRCAIYYPSLERADSFGTPGDRRIISPSGHMLGIYARTDSTRGVHKAPANEVVRGVLAFDKKLDKGVQDILNPINLNCLRDFRSENRGLRVYGARVATSDPEFKYINVRRLLLMIAQSLDTGLQWAVFEPNDKMLWDTVKQSITGFLTTIWRSGALEGQKAEEAFFVNIGYNVTMTQDDIDNGRMIVEIGVAPVKPAEFVIVRISQKTREAQG